MIFIITLKNKSKIHPPSHECSAGLVAISSVKHENINFSRKASNSVKFECYIKEKGEHDKTGELFALKNICSIQP